MPAPVAYTTSGVLRNTLQWRHNGHDGVSNHLPYDCLLGRVLGADERKHQSSTSLAFVRGIHRSPGNFPYKGPVTQKMFPFDDVIMLMSGETCNKEYFMVFSVLFDRNIIDRLVEMLSITTNIYKTSYHNTPWICESHSVQRLNS